MKYQCKFHMHDKEHYNLYHIYNSCLSHMKKSEFNDIILFLYYIYLYIQLIHIFIYIFTLKNKCFVVTLKKYIRKNDKTMQCLFHMR